MDEEFAQEVIKCMEYAENLCRYVDHDNYLYTCVAAAEVLGSGIGLVKDRIDDDKMVAAREEAAREEVSS